MPASGPSPHTLPTAFKDKRHCVILQGAITSQLLGPCSLISYHFWPRPMVVPQPGSWNAIPPSPQTVQIGLILFFCFFVFLLVGTLIGVRWRLTVVLMCISLMISGVEHLYIC